MAAAAHSNGQHLSTADSSSCRQPPVRNRLFRPCSLSMNGCGGGWAAAGVRETHTLPPVSAPELAAPQLKLAVSALEADPPASSSGIIRLQVPIRQRADALEWLRAQGDEDREASPLPRCFFSSRGQPETSWLLPSLGNGRSGDVGGDDREPVSVAGVGSAVFFRGADPFSLADWRSIKRFLSKDSPLIRAYGAMRFDASTAVSPEWKDFGSFFFVVPQKMTG